MVQAQFKERRPTYSNGLKTLEEIRSVDLVSSIGSRKHMLLMTRGQVNSLPPSISQAQGSFPIQFINK